MDVWLNTLVSGRRSRTEGPLSPVVLPLSRTGLSPALCLSSSPSDQPPPSCHHSITPKGKLWQEGAGLGPSHPLPGILGVGRERSREKPSSELKFGDCQCQEKLNNPVTSMKVNSRSAAHGKYECSVRRAEGTAESACHGGQPPLQGPRQGGRRRVMHSPVPAREQPPGSPD